MTAAFALMGFPSTAANIVFLLTTGSYCYIYFLVVILFDWHSRMDYCHIVMPVVAWVVCLRLLLKIKDSWFLIPGVATWRDVVCSQLVHVLAQNLFNTQFLPENMLTGLLFGPLQAKMSEMKYKQISSARIMSLMKCHRQNGGQLPRPQNANICTFM